MQELARQQSGGYGSTAGAVSPQKNLQAALVWTDNYPGPIDGEIGESTIAAIKKFQTEIDQPSTGLLTATQSQVLLAKASERIKDLEPVLN